MNLRTGQPVWLSKAPKDFAFPALKENLTCDVAIIGAGVTAALTLHRLVQAGLSVIVLDRRAVGRGSTAASTGLLLYQTDTSLAELARFHGEKTAARAYELGREAIRDLGKIVRELKIDCGFQTKRSLYVASDRAGRTKLRTEAKRENRLHFASKLLSEKRVAKRFHFRRPSALEATGNAQVDAFRLTRGIFRHYRRHRLVRFFQHTTVSKISEASGEAIVRTMEGHRVHARFAIVAAGYESGRFVRSKLVRLHSTYVIASRPFPVRALWPSECLMWETSRPYFYLRLTSDRRIVFGGEDEAFSNAHHRDRLLPQKTATLEKKFAELFPRLAFRASFAWTGTFAETIDGLPCIGPSKKNSRILCALGYGGNGITFSQIAARILHDHCLGQVNPDTRFFRLDRKVRACLKEKSEA